MKRTGIVAASLVIGLATAAAAHKGATGIVKDRMVAMSQMGDAVKAVAPMMSGEQPYDAALVRDAAETIKGHSGDAMTTLFPADNENMASYAKDSIWDNWDTFADLAGQLDTYAEGLSLAADNAPDDQSDGMADTAAMMGADTMMGDGGMMGNGSAEMADLTVQDLASMPASDVFSKVSDTCSSCHTQFRTKAE